MTVRIAGTKATRKAVEAYRKRVRLGVDEAVDVIALRIAYVAKDLIETSPASGHIYRRENPDRIHRASAPGEPPANDLGNLVNSIKVTDVRINQHAFASVVGSNLHYAIELEYGNLSAKLLPRPWLRPAVKLVEKEIGGLLADTWGKYKL